MKVLVAGASGQLGRQLVELLEQDPGTRVVPARKEVLDVTRADQVREVIGHHAPDWVVNCTAYNDVEGAEDHAELAHLVNDIAIGHLADAALACRARLVHISTDYVFSPPRDPLAWRPFHEGDRPEPLSAYARSKLAGERRLEAHEVRKAILRTSWLYGGAQRNFLSTMLRRGAEAVESGQPVKVVDDQWGTPTDVWSLATQVRKVLLEEAFGLFHASCEGATTWCEFARAIFRQARLPAAVEPIRLADYPARAQRPRYSVLEKRELLRRGIHVLPHWTQGLELTLRRR